VVSHSCRCVYGKVEKAADEVKHVMGALTRAELGWML